MLASGAHAFLRANRARHIGFFLAGKIVFERHHASIGEQQRRIVQRHKRAGGNALVLIMLKIIQKTVSDIGNARRQYFSLRSRI